MQRSLVRAAGLGQRRFSSLAEPITYPGFVELREYTLKPEESQQPRCPAGWTYAARLECTSQSFCCFVPLLSALQGIKDFMQLTEKFIGLRKELLPFLGMWMCDTGGVLNRVLHLYQYGDFDHRDRCRSAAAASEEWQQQYLSHSRRAVAHQESTIFEPTAKVLQAAGAVALADFRPPPRAAAAPQPLYELRRFQLQPGYDGLPLLQAAYKRGIGNKIAAIGSRGQLVFFGHSEVGMLNQVIELWRFESAQACEDARQAARADPEWRATVGAVSTGVQHFSTSFLHALPFSPLQ